MFCAHRNVTYANCLNLLGEPKRPHLKAIFGYRDISGAKNPKIVHCRPPGISLFGITICTYATSYIK